MVRYGAPGGPLHDPCVIAYLLQPTLFSGRRCSVQIECASELTMGQTVVDWWGIGGRPANANLIIGIDSAGFFDLVFDRLSRLARRKA
jgi:purine nucleosidase